MGDYSLTDVDKINYNFGSSSSVINTQNSKNIATSVDGVSSVSVNINLDKNIDSSAGATVGFVSQAQWLIVEKVAGENIDTHKMIRFQDANTVVYSKSDGVYADAKPIGISITSAITGGKIKVLILGIVEGSDFPWANGTRLFLGPNGTITSTVPTSGYSTIIGEALAVGVISLSIGTPIRL